MRLILCSKLSSIDLAACRRRRVDRIFVHGKHGKHGKKVIGVLLSKVRATTSHRYEFHFGTKGNKGNEDFRNGESPRDG